MFAKIRYGMVLSVLAGLGLAFWAGRASRPGNAADLSTGGRLAQRAERLDARKSGPGGGGQSATSALHLRDIFKNNGGNRQLGVALADAALAKMNGQQLTQLVHNLATAQATTPGYSYSLEISAACARWAEVDPDAALLFALSTKQTSFRNASICSIIAGIAKYDPALARAKLATIDDPSLRRSAQSGMLSALMVASPDEWIVAIKADPALGRQYSMGSMAGEWAMDDPAMAAKRVMQLPTEMQRGGVAAIAKVWAGKDSAAATTWAQSLTDPQQRNQALAAIAGGIAAQDPDAALASLASLTPAARRAGLTSVFSTMADLDFDAALAKASALTDPADRKTALAMLAGAGNSYGYNGNYGSYDSYVGGYSSRSSEQLSAVLATLPTGSLRNNALNQLGSQLAVCSREEAAAILADYPQQEREKLQSSMLQQLSYSDPARALEIYQSLPPGNVESYNLASIYSNLATKDPEAVLKLLADKPPKEQAQGVGYAFAQLARNDPEAATRRLDEYPAGPVRDAALGQLTGAWAQDDPAAAKAWVTTLAGAEQVRALNSLIPALAGSDPKGAADILGRLLATTPKDADGNLSSATSNLVSTWARDDPTAAGSWTTTLPDGNMKTQAISNLAATWAQEDFAATGKWIDSMPDGQARDSGVSSMVSVTTRRDPATAFAWAATIGDNQNRVNMLSNVVQQWKESDPDKARAAVQRADLTSDERDRLLKRFK